MDFRKQLGMNAYDTIMEAWNPKEAAGRLYRFSEGLLKGEINPEESGPLSIAPVIRPKKGYFYTHSYICEKNIR